MTQRSILPLIAVLAFGFCSSSALANRACCFPDGRCEMFRTIEEHNEFCLPFGGETQGSGVTCEDDPPPCGLCGDGILNAGEECDDGNNVDGDGCSADCTSEDGCTPGFWKQVQHLALWTGLAPDDIFSEVFGAGPTITLFEAVNLRGGGENRLVAHAVAAILNASNPDVDYNLTVAEIIALVQDAFATGDFRTAKNIFVAENERGCPIDSVCGDGICQGSENNTNCAIDCACVTSADCDDGVACTIDACVSSACENTPDNGVCLDDGQFCNGTEVCDAGVGCTSTGDSCGAAATCNETTDTCDACVPKNDSCTAGAECCSGVCKHNGRCR